MNSSQTERGSDFCFVNIKRREQMKHAVTTGKNLKKRAWERQWDKRQWERQWDNAMYCGTEKCQHAN